MLEAFEANESEKRIRM